MTFIGTLELPGEMEDSRAMRWRRRVFGPRLIDGPVRGIALLLMVLSLLPTNFDQPGPLYAATVVACAVLTLLGAWFPGTVALLSTAGFMGETLLFPASLGNFFLPLIVSGAVALVHQRWGAMTGATAGLGLATIVQTFTWPDPASSPPVWGDWVIWLLAITLAGGALLLQIHLDRAVAHATDSAVEAERQLELIRLQHAADTHDTVSNALMTQKAIITVLAGSPQSTVDRQILGELALVNSRAQLGLRQLLARIHGTRSAASPVDLLREIERTMLTIRSSTEAAGYTIRSTMSIVGMPVSASFVDEVQLILFELVTNILKHSGSPDRATLEVSTSSGSHGRELILATSNPASPRDDLPAAPWSIEHRARRLDGACTMAQRDHWVHVRVTIPLKCQSDHPEAHPCR